MAPTLKRKGIAISNRPPAKRQKATHRRVRENTPTSADQEHSGYPDEEWPLKRILQERKKEYLVLWADHPRTGETYDPQWACSL